MKLSKWDYADDDDDDGDDDDDDDDDENFSFCDTSHS